MVVVEYVGKIKEGENTTYTYNKTDKNGTQYYTASKKCYLCKGTGYVDYFKFYANGTCFPCHGTGYEHYPVKVYTEEYWKKLEASRIERAERAKEREEIREREKAEKALNTCMINHDRKCDTCQHRGYCTLLGNAKATFENIEEKTEFQNWVLNIIAPVKMEDPEIVTLAGEPCRVSKWFDNNFGGSSRRITKPDGTKIYTSASTDKGLKRYGLKNYVKEEK